VRGYTKKNGTYDQRKDQFLLYADKCILGRRDVVAAIVESCTCHQAIQPRLGTSIIVATTALYPADEDGKF
jgi:hypothetical protein